MASNETNQVKGFTMKPYLKLILLKLRYPRCQIEWVELRDGVVVKRIAW